MFYPNRFSLFGSEGPKKEDVIQGGLGDCWFHAAVAGIASSDPSKIRNLFLTPELNSAGVYAVKLYLMGIPVSVTVDEFLLFDFKSEKGLTYARKPKHNALWMPILEKAVAKLLGNY